MVHYYMIQSVRVVSCVDAQRWLAFPSPLEPLNLSKKNSLCLLWQIGFFNDQNVLRRRRRSLLKYFSLPLTHSSILIKVNDKSKKQLRWRRCRCAEGSNKKTKSEIIDKSSSFFWLFFFVSTSRRRNDLSLSSILIRYTLHIPEYFFWLEISGQLMMSACGLLERSVRKFQELLACHRHYITPKAWIKSF